MDLLGSGQKKQGSLLTIQIIHFTKSNLMNLKLIKYINKPFTTIIFQNKMQPIKAQNPPKNINQNPIQSKDSLTIIKAMEKPPLPKKTKTMEKPPLTNKISQSSKTFKYDYICDQRKQNILNSRFLRKKQKLFEITRQNVRLFQKISSQKSLYSHKSLQKSYQSSRQLINLRVSNISISRQLKKSRISNCSSQSSRLDKSNKDPFLNRVNSAVSIRKQNVNKIIVRNVKRMSVNNQKQKEIQQTKVEDIKQCGGLFNIKQEPSGKQRNRPIRIRSTKVLKSSKKMTEEKENSFRRFSNKQIVINEENRIQIHEQISLAHNDKLRRESSRVLQEKRIEETRNKGTKSVLQQDPNIHVFPVPIHLRIKNSECARKINIDERIKCDKMYRIKGDKVDRIKGEKLGNSQCQQSINGVGNENMENLFEIKNSLVRSKLDQNPSNSRVATKYTNLLSKISSQLNKYMKKPTQNNNFPFRSRLIA